MQSLFIAWPIYLLDQLEVHQLREDLTQLREVNSTTTFTRVTGAYQDTLLIMHNLQTKLGNIAKSTVH